MKKLFILSLCLLLLAAPLSAQAGVTLRTTSNLFAIEEVAQVYMDALLAWEQATGNTVEDYSGLPDEIWNTIVPRDLQNELYDVLYYYIADDASAAILDKVVSLDEVKAAYPDANIQINPLAAEADGKVYAIPVTYYWEALYCNADLFETHGLELPTSWEKLGAAVMKFRESGIPPIALSLTDYPHHMFEALMLATCSPADQGASPQGAADMPASWADALDLFRGLYGAGTFGQNSLHASELETSQAFIDKEAAMQYDGSWFLSRIPEESMNSTVVIPFPVYTTAADPAALVGNMSMGFYITRAAWDDPQRREAAVSLLQALTTVEILSKLVGEPHADDILGESIQAMLAGATKLYKPVGERLTSDAHEILFSSIPGVATGDTQAVDLLQQVIEMGAFRVEN